MSIIKTFRAADRGLGKVLGHLEEDIMEALWMRDGATGKDVLSGLNSNNKKVAYTTVLTVLERLSKKGLVKKEKINGSYKFTPAYSKADFSRIVSKEVLKGVLDMGGGYASANFVDAIAESDPNELERLSKLIEAKKSELKIR